MFIKQKLAKLLVTIISNKTLSYDLKLVTYLRAQGKYIRVNMAN